MVRNILILCGVVIVLLLGYALISNTNTLGERVTIEGTYICLPHVDTSGPQTLECAFGIQTENGVNYALDTSTLATGVITNFETNDSIIVQGKLTPRDALGSEDHLRIYDIDGVIHVTSVASHEDTAETNRHVVTGGSLSFERPNDFGLAVRPEQILVQAVIPPCDEGFDYCLYYNADAYEDTNFEAAGLAIEERSDLDSEEQCLTTPPEGYSTMTPSMRVDNEYKVSTFSPVGDAGAGHYATGDVYRLAFDSSCYEFETRIGETQFENYEPGTIDEFTDADHEAVQNRLENILSHIRFTDNEAQVIFP